MQTNGSAFEAWALALHVWLKTRIRLEWDIPKNLSPRSEGELHYQRFLYRMWRFHDLFGRSEHPGGWLNVPDIDEAGHCRAFKFVPSYINVPGERSKPLVTATSKREARAEAAFLDFFRQVGAPFNLTESERQIPVGLFEKKVPTGREAIFTGRKSAIDLMGVREDEVSVFELKAGANQSLGKLSELLFYVHLLRDAVGPGARFKFAGTGQPYHIERWLEGCKSMKAILLVENDYFHPLLRHHAIKPMLDAALSSPAFPVIFEAWKYDGLDEVLLDHSNVGTLKLTQIKGW